MHVLRLAKTYTSSIKNDLLIFNVLKDEDNPRPFDPLRSSNGKETVTYLIIKNYLMTFNIGS